ncbi:2OG-Fe(II) oxygenase [Nonomuraea sp. NPDC049152]|uniref:2OG-Fe(II) oxygenase n=1 Tax=Nonomuraea sp. NPDC049152 TaxID=3154350 RepID=UPI0034070FA3
MTITSVNQPPLDLDAVFPAFHWHVYDVGTSLPVGWIRQLLEVSERRAVARDFKPTMSTAREEQGTIIPIEAVDGDVLAAEVPWLRQLYYGAFQKLGQSLVSDEVQPSADLKVALSLNVQRGNGVRYPCHVDSNPVEGLLYLTDCTEQTGGALAVARNAGASTKEEVDADCALIYPRAGQLLFFDARRNPHYVRPLHNPNGVRAVVTMNYYSDACPESMRPVGLDDQLFVTETPADLAD